VDAQYVDDEGDMPADSTSAAVNWRDFRHVPLAALGLKQCSYDHDISRSSPTEYLQPHHLDRRIVFIF
jgi:hypothetical protein